MSKSKSWLPHEDKALLGLYEERNIRKWAKISMLLARQYGIRKSAKKCRERYKNHLNPSINKDEWSNEEEMLLLQAQNALGNRWAEISRKIPGRTDNSVKNKFYSLFRKSIGNINTLVRNQNLQRKELQISFIYKLVSFLDSKFKPGNQHPEDFLVQAEQLKTKILQYSNLNIQAFVPDADELTSLFEQVNLINSYFKKKIVRRSHRRFSARQQQLTKVQQSKQKQILVSHDHQPGKMLKHEEKESANSIIKKSESPSLFVPLPIQKVQISTGQNFEGISMFSWRDDDSDIWKLSKKHYSSPQEYS